jgi:hypothetical protein
VSFVALLDANVLYPAYLSAVEKKVFEVTGSGSGLTEGV